MCIEGNAYFYSGGGHARVGTNYEHVTCLSVWQHFRFAALLGIVLNL